MSGRTLHRAVAMLLVALVVCAAPVASAQRQEVNSNQYTSELTGVDIEVTGPTFEISEAELQHYADGRGEMVQIDSPVVASSLEVSFYDDNDAPNQTIDIYLNVLGNVSDSFEILDRGVLGDHSYALALIVFEGLEIVFYVQVYEDFRGTADLLEAVLTASATFETDLQLAQVEVTIDGVPFMGNVDASELGAVVVSGGTIGEGIQATPVDATETATFSLADVSVGLGPDFSFVTQPQILDGLESLRIQGPNTLSIIAIGETGASPVVVLDSFATGITSVYGSAESVYQEIDTQIGWRLLWILKNDGSATFLLIMVDTTAIPGVELLHAHELPAASVAGSVLTIQNQVFLNGQSLLADIDPEEIAFHADEHFVQESPIGTEEVADESTVEATEETTGSRTSDPRDAARLPDTSDSDDPGNTTETGDRPGTTPIGPDTPGTLTDSSWQGGVLGHLIEWDPATWFVDPDFHEDLVSDEANQEDTIVLQTSTEYGVSWLFINVFGDTNVTPDDWLDHWLSPEFLESPGMIDADPEVLTTRTRGESSAVMVRYTDSSGSEFILVRQATTLEDGSVTIITFDTPVEDGVQMYEQALEITIDGEPALRVISAVHFERALED